MASHYRAVFSDFSVEFFTALSRRRQRKLLDRARELAADPFLIPNYSTKDSDGRDTAHLLVGDFIFTYHVDHATRLVMITEIDDAE